MKELEDIEILIRSKKLELESLERRREEILQQNKPANTQPLFDMHLDPARRNWEYDGYGRRIARSGE